MKYFWRISNVLFVFFCFMYVGCTDATPDNNISETTESVETAELAEGYPVESAYPGPVTTITRLDITSTRIAEVSTPQTGLATLTGVVFSERTNAPVVEVPVQLAEVYYEGDRGAFVLDTGQGPTAYTDGQGRFVFVDIEARDYVIVIGNVEVNDYKIVPEENGKARVWVTTVGDVLDTGSHWVLLQSWE